MLIKCEADLEINLSTDMYINANSDRFSGMTLNLAQEGGIGIFG